jgi:hypothetical protein
MFLILFFCLSWCHFDNETKMNLDGPQYLNKFLSQPYFGQVWGWSPTLGKSEDLESSGTPECLELDSKAQNTSHWGVLDVIGKVLKRTCRKWPRISHLDICSPSYGQKKGRESNWQFDSRPLKVGNWPPNRECNTSLERSRRRLQVWFRPRHDQTSQSGSYELPKSRDSTRDSFGTISGLQPGSPRSPGKKWHSGVGAAESYRVYYREYGGGILPRSGPWCVSWSKVPVACPNTQGCPGMWINHMGGLFWCRFKLDLLVPLPSLIPGLPTRPSTPFLSWKPGACLQISTFRNLTLWNPQVGFTPWLGSASVFLILQNIFLVEWVQKPNTKTWSLKLVNPW